MKYVPKKVFVLENGKYMELNYQEFYYRFKLVKTYQVFCFNSWNADGSR